MYTLSISKPSDYKYVDFSNIDKTKLDPDKAVCGQALVECNGRMPIRLEDWAFLYEAYSERVGESENKYQLFNYCAGINTGEYSPFHLVKTLRSRYVTKKFVEKTSDTVSSAEYEEKPDIDTVAKSLGIEFFDSAEQEDNCLSLVLMKKLYGALNVKIFSEITDNGSCRNSSADDLSYRTGSVNYAYSGTIKLSSEKKEDECYIKAWEKNTLEVSQRPVGDFNIGEDKTFKAIGLGYVYAVEGHKREHFSYYRSSYKACSDDGAIVTWTPLTDEPFFSFDRDIREAYRLFDGTCLKIKVNSWKWGNKWKTDGSSKYYFDATLYGVYCVSIWEKREGLSYVEEEYSYKLVKLGNAKMTQTGYAELESENVTLDFSTKDDFATLLGMPTIGATKKYVEDNLEYPDAGYNEFSSDWDGADLPNYYHYSEEVNTLCRKVKAEPVSFYALIDGFAWRTTFS